MRISYIAVIVALLFGSPAPAQDSSSLNAAKELFSLVGERTMEDMVTSMSGPMWASIENSLQGKIDAATSADLRQEFERIMKKHVSQAMLKAPEIYARHYTVGELRDLIAFYKSPIGQKLLQKTPQVMGDMTQTVLVPMMAPMQEDIKTSFDNVMKKHGRLK